MSLRKFCAAAALGFAALAAVDQAAAQTFPPIQPGQTSYVIKPEEANGLIIGTLYLPKDFTLKVDPGVRSINWSVSVLKFDDGATIDLSAPEQQAAGGGDGGKPQPQGGYCTQGQAGQPGGNGAPGLSGVNLTISNLAPINSQGTLWIKTDGQPGGNGGNGGDGQTGGGHKSVRAGLGGGGSCGAGGGGDPGRPGAGGAGGPTGKVTLIYAGQSQGTTPNTVLPNCGHSQRPDVPAGAIMISGRPGCPGASGRSGNHGHPG